MQIVLKAVSDTVETGLTKRHIISAIEAERDTIFDTVAGTHRRYAATVRLVRDSRENKKEVIMRITRKNRRYQLPDEVLAVLESSPNLEPCEEFRYADIHVLRSI